MENLQKKPVKGILKSSSSFEQPEPHLKSSVEPIKWDEMNILQTLHPPDKDYGLMKIEEPKTPYNYYKDTVDGEPVSDDEREAASSGHLDLESIVEKIERKPSKVLLTSESSADDDESDDREYEELTEEEKKRRQEFEVKRKMHYNEYHAVKLARKLLEEEDEDDSPENEKDEGKDENKDGDKGDDEGERDEENMDSVGDGEEGQHPIAHNDAETNQSED